MGGDVVRNEGEEARFHCVVSSGHHNPKFTWYFGGIKQGVETDTFIIPSVHRDSNQKLVTCQGEPTDGVKSENSSVLLTVQCKCPINILLLNMLF